ncbi:MAG: glycosyltransferase family 2 protein [bacterium]|nr:glycosyltransferase family 2 protein [bacterium]
MLSIIVPTHDKVPRLRLCLQVLRAAVDGAANLDCEVVVVDDGSTDATPELLEAVAASWDGQLRVRRLPRAIGRAAARNAGADSAAGRRLLFLDDDILADPAVLEHHERAAKLADRPVLARATILNLPWLRHLDDPLGRIDSLPPRLAERVRRLGDGGRIPGEPLRQMARRSPFEADLHGLLRTHPYRGRWPASTGGNLSIDAAFFHELGGFDTAMGRRWGVEDLELGFRAEARGAYIAHLDDVAVFHMDHPVPGRDQDHRINLAYFGRKHGRRLGERLAAYFVGDGDLEEVVT